jgi:hypothetical protein
VGRVGNLLCGRASYMMTGADAVSEILRSFH